MKKLLKVISACALSTAVVASAAVSASAAGINSAEQRILDELHTTVPMMGIERRLPVVYINQTENYLNTVELTDEEADQIIAGINETKAYLTSTNADGYDGLTDSQIDIFFSYCQKTVSVIDLTITYNKATRVGTIVDKNNKVIFTATLGSGKNPSGNPGQNSGGDIVDPNPIKTTGFDFNIPGMITVAGAGILFVSAAGVYLFSRKKKVESENA